MVDPDRTPVDPDIAQSEPPLPSPIQEMTPYEPEPASLAVVPAPSATIVKLPWPGEPAFPSWTYLDVMAVLGTTVVVILLFSLIALGLVRQIPAYRHDSIVALAANPLVVVGSQVVAYPVVVAFIILLVRSRTQEPFLQAIRWNWPLHGATAYFVLGVILAFAVQLLSRALPIPKSLPIDKFFYSATSAYLMAVFGTTLAPLLEELFFRGLLYPLLRRSLKVVWAVAITAAVFAAIHGAQLGYAWGPIFSIFIVGVALTLVRERTDSVAASFLTHCGYNSSLFVVLWLASDHFQHLEKVAG